VNRRDMKRTGGRRRKRTSTVAVLAAAAIAAVSVGAAGATAADQKASKSAPAVQTVKKSMWGPPSGPNGSIFPTLKDLGVGLYSIQARWDQIAPLSKPLLPTNPNDPAYQWPQYLVDAVTDANAQGIEVQILIMGSPPWANGGRSWEFVPDNPQDYADFATAASQKFPTVDHWMIWGEPNRTPNFKPSTPAKKPTGKLSGAEQVGPRNYAVLLEAAYQALKAASPNNKVIGGNTYTAAGKDDTNTYQWAQNMKLPDGSRPHMDMWGHNPWGFTEPNFKTEQSRRGTVTFNDLKRLTKVLDKSFPGQKLKLFLAEWGVPSGFKDKDLGYGLKVKEANRWINTAFKLVRGYKRIYSLGWVHLFDNPRNSTGLMTQDGVVKPTYKTYKKAKA
jgi:hypothetical protein